MSGIPVWRDHRGDGDLVVHAAGCLDDTQLEDAKQLTHDSVIDGAGARRAGPVSWFIYGPSTSCSPEDGIELCARSGLQLEEGLVDYLREGPGRSLVVAMVATDKISRRTPARAKRRRR